MSKFFRKRIVFPIIGAVALVFSLVFALVSTPKTYAQKYNLYKTLTYSDIVNTGLSASYIGSKDVWDWIGIKDPTANGNKIIRSKNWDMFSVQARSTTDTKMQYLTKVEYSFTINKAGSLYLWYGERMDDYTYTSGLNNGTIELKGDEATEFTFEIITGDNDDVTEITSFELKLYYGTPYTVTATAGSGVAGVKLTSDYDSHSHKLHESGYQYKDGATVYLLAGISEGYEVDPSWPYVISSIVGNKFVDFYLVDSKTINGANLNFGTITANPVTRTFTLDNNGGTGSGTVDLTYGQAAQIPGTGFSRELFTLDGWNTKADGSGESYSSNLSVDDVNEILTERDYDTWQYISTLYAKWKINAAGVKTLIDNIGEIAFTPASKGRIKEARAGYDSLSDEEKEQVDNIDLLLAAEEIFNALFERYAEAQIGNTLYAFLPEAFEALNAGDTITLRHDVDLSNDNIEITKNVTIDLNGHILKTTMEDGNSGIPTLFVSSNNTIFEIRNSKPATGGLNGLVIVDVNAVNSYVKVNDCRLVLPVDNINNANTLKVGPGYEALNINADGSADENGFISIVKPLEVFDISNLDEDYIVPDGQILTGHLHNPVKISILDSATVTLKDLNINSNYISFADENFAGITCLGDAELIIKGSNDLFGFKGGAGIFVPEGHTLTIDGDGILYSYGRDGAAGIGGNANTNSGNIIINGGEINASGGTKAAGIGGGYSEYNDLQSGNITINGGRISSTAADAAGIGSAVGEACGDITINGGVVAANSSHSSSTGNCGSGIGSGKDGSCGAVAITDNVALVKATARDNEKEIGGNCLSLDIANTLTAERIYETISYFHKNTVIIDGQVVNDSHSSGEGWSYDKATNTLTLDGYVYEGPGKVYSNFTNYGGTFIAAISYEGEDDFIINLVGENTIIVTQDGTPFNVCGIHSAGKESTDIKFTGNGSLSISFTGENPESYAIAAGSSVTIDGPTIVANGGNAIFESAGIYVRYDGLYVISGSLTATASECSVSDSSYGINSNGSDIIIGENTKSVIASGYTNAIYANVFNAIEGIGWTDVLGTEGETAIETSTTGAQFDAFKYIHFIGITPEDVIAFINAIGDVEYTSSCKEKIDTARDAYDFLKQEEQAEVTNYDKLVAAEAIYNHVDDTFKKINAIGDVEYTSASKALIDAARSAYDKLTVAEVALLPNYSTLTSAEAMYNHVDDSTVKIDAIGEVKYTEECKALIDTARSAYNALTEAEKDILLNYEKLTLAESTYNTLENQAVANVKNLIDAIGDVEFTEESKAKIDAARSAYDALNNNSKELVDNINTLLAAEELYNNVLNVVEKINDALNPNYDTASKTKIDTARNAYNALTPLEKALVVNYESLTKTEDDYAKVDAVVKEINNLGNITYDIASDTKIKTARTSVETLTVDQKKFLPETSENTLEDYETTYQVLEQIYSMNSVKYSSESKEEIEEVRKAYDNLTEEQKELINEADLKKLENKEATYKKIKGRATAWVIILLIFTINLITAGGLFLYMLLKDIEIKKNTKAMSLGLPIIILASYYASSPYVTLYVFLGIALLVWISVLVLYLLKKYEIFFVKKNQSSQKSLDESKALAVAKPMAIVEVKEEKKESKEKDTKPEEKVEVKEEPKPEVEKKTEPEAEAKPEEAKPMVVEETKAEDATETTPEAEEAEEEEVETLTDESGNTFKIQYVKSFTAKLILASDEVKNEYNELKKEILAYKGTKAKITWHYETISIKKNVLLRFAIRGKTLYLYFNLDPNEYTDTKYKVENVTSKKHIQAPCLYRIKNDRRFNYAKELIEVLSKKFELEKGELPNEDYRLPLETKEALLEKGLIKKLETKINK